MRSCACALEAMTTRKSFKHVAMLLRLCALSVNNQWDAWEFTFQVIAIIFGVRSDPVLYIVYCCAAITTTAVGTLSTCFCPYWTFLQYERRKNGPPCHLVSAVFQYHAVDVVHLVNSARTFCSIAPHVVQSQALVPVNAVACLPCFSAEHSIFDSGSETDDSTKFEMRSVRSTSSTFGECTSNTVTVSATTESGDSACPQSTNSSSHSVLVSKADSVFKHGITIFSWDCILLPEGRAAILLTTTTAPQIG